MNVAIVMACKNGQNFLPAQLNSLERQTYSNWRLHAFDDGSIDGSRAILQARIKQDPKRFAPLHRGPDQGFGVNFLSGLQHLSSETEYAGFCDQDDIWLPNKVAAAIQALNDAGPQPALYCSKRTVWHTDGTTHDESPLQNRPGFANALVQNIASGNTIFMNNAALAAVRQSIGRIALPTFHDWWCYTLITGIGGRIIYDHKSHILYRQHPRNTLGARSAWAHMPKRLGMVMRGVYKAQINRNLTALSQVSDMLTPSNRMLLSSFQQARTNRLAKRATAVRGCGVYRQSTAGNISLFGAAAVGLV